MQTPTSSAPDGSCYYCGMHHTGICWRITKIEYHPDGSVKSVEFGDKQQMAANPTVISISDSGAIQS